MTRGQVIAETGNTHRQSAHFHFEMSWINPYDYYKGLFGGSLGLNEDMPAGEQCNRKWIGSCSYDERVKYWNSHKGEYIGY